VELVGGGGYTISLSNDTLAQHTPMKTLGKNVTRAANRPLARLFASRARAHRDGYRDNPRKSMARAGKESSLVRV
jgi:hypothetical protein